MIYLVVFFLWMLLFFFFFSSRRRHTRWTGDWSSDVCSSDLDEEGGEGLEDGAQGGLLDAAGRPQDGGGRAGEDEEVERPAGERRGQGERPLDRSEERRVGKECRSRWSPDQ